MFPVSTEPRINEAKGKTLLAIPRVRVFLEALANGTPHREAAKLAGLRSKRARQIIHDPVVRREFRSITSADMFLERPRNIAMAVSIRDRAMQPDASAAEKKAGLEAARYLDGEAESGSVHYHTTNNVIAGGSGYVIDLSGEKTGAAAIVNQPAIDAKPLRLNDAVTIDAE